VYIQKFLKKNHGTVPMISIYDGMYFLYPWYKMNSNFVDVLRNPGAVTLKQ
jgi:hypothetical protein